MQSTGNQIATHFSLLGQTIQSRWKLVKYSLKGCHETSVGAEQVPSQAASPELDLLAAYERAIGEVLDPITTQLGGTSDYQRRDTRWLSGGASAFASGRDPRALGSSPTLGSLHGACFSLCLCLCTSLCLS